MENFNDDPENKNTFVDPTQRKSETAWLANGDAVVDCVKSRAAEFQGFAPNKSMEELAVLKYKPGGSFTPHYDCKSAMAFALPTHPPTLCASFLPREKAVAGIE